MNRLTDEIVRRLENSRVTVSDLHNTLIESKFHFSLPKYFLSCFSNSRSLNEIRTYLGEFLKTSFSGTNISNLKEKTYSSFVRGVPEGIYYHAKEKYIRAHELNGVSSFIETIKTFGNPKKFIISTRDHFAEPAAKYFGADDLVANKTIFKNGHFDHLEISIKNSKDKLIATEKKLKEHSLRLDDCFFIGDKLHDLEIGNKASVFGSSPKAIREIKREADIHIDDYRKFEMQLRRFQTKML